MRYICLLMVLSSSCLAQQSGSTEPSAAEEGQSLRLEATVRANKEQPRVLSIVPWQLPGHRQIDQALEWQPTLAPPALIERHQFRQQLGLARQEDTN